MIVIPKTFTLPTSELRSATKEQKKLAARAIAEFASRLIKVDIDGKTAALSTASPSQEVFQYTSIEWLELAIAHCSLGSDSHILDVGCGAGRMAVAAAQYLNESGTYVGFDPLEQQIRYCRQTIQRPTFTFHHVDLQHRLYQPLGKIDPNTYLFPKEDNSTDIVVSASVVTHLEKETAQHHLHETYRVLKPGARAMYYTFALTADMKPRDTSTTPLFGKSLAWNREHNPHFQWRFAHREDGFYTHCDEEGHPKNHYMDDVVGDPVAYDVESFSKMANKAKLDVVEFLPGAWCRDQYVHSYQDIFILEKRL